MTRSTYYCTKHKRNHYYDSEVGKKCLRFAAKGKQKEMPKIKIPKLQRRYSNGNWDDLSEKELKEYFNMALKKQQWITKNIGGETPNTEEKLLKALKKKRELQFGDDWYAKIRRKLTKSEKEAEEKRLEEVYQKTMEYQHEQEKWQRNLDRDW